MQISTAHSRRDPDEWRDIFEQFFPSLAEYTSIYKDLHQHPELPCQEVRTSAVVADHLESLGYTIQRKIGGHGVVAVLENGAGKTVMLRAELDAIPIEENTGLPYASKAKQVDTDGMTKSIMHACGHDMHMASLLGCADLLTKVQHAWSGTVVCVFQPNEERLLGAQAMIDDGLFEKIPLPDFLLGQHAVPTKAGTIGLRAGRVLGFLDSLAIRVYGRGTHSSTPERGNDPILTASNIISRLQSVVSRETSTKVPRAVTSGYFHAGTDASIIPDYADFKVDIRSYDKDIQRAMVDATKRIIEGECRTADSPKTPDIVISASCPPIDNDKEATELLTRALHTFYGDKAPGKIIEMNLDMTADDFVLLGHPPGKKPIPYVYWNFGATSREKYEQAEKDGTISDLPVNHNARFAPEIGPALQTGIEGMSLAAVTFLSM